jgi:uncharacterized membrane protein
MAKRIRLIFALVVLVISLALLVWAFWPFGHLKDILTIPPGKLQLPTPGGFLPGFLPFC